MPETRFLSIEDVMALHADTIAEDGGAPGLRDMGMLESALAMPRATFAGAYLHQTLAEQAAAYLFDLCQAHAFIDGNKRSAVLCAHAFLDVNGHEFACSADELFDVVVAVADSGLGKAELCARMPALIRRRR